MYSAAPQPAIISREDFEDTVAQNALRQMEDEQNQYIQALSTEIQGLVDALNVARSQGDRTDITKLKKKLEKLLLKQTKLQQLKRRPAAVAERDYSGALRAVRKKARRSRRLQKKDPLEFTEIDTFDITQAVESRIRPERRRRLRKRVRDVTEEATDNGTLEMSITSEVLMLDGLYVPKVIYDRLLPFQKEGLQWFWELFKRNEGGILGDDPGLGKTIQAIAFLASLDVSHLFKGGLILLQKTLLNQWVEEFRKWFPSMRVVVAHSDFTTLSSETDIEELIYMSPEQPHVVITTYTTFRTYAEAFCAQTWGIVLLDEGHMIRNPTSTVTQACKKLQCNHRFVLSGTPMQNNLRELWSLFDFCNPGLLGSLSIFIDRFATPITVGGYSHATPDMISRAQHHAFALQELIKPYIMRRQKTKVIKLPPKSEQVVFCELTPTQRTMYINYIQSDEVHKMLQGKLNSLGGIQCLRDICDHPIIHATKRATGLEVIHENSPIESGKMMVLFNMIREWQTENQSLIEKAETELISYEEAEKKMNRVLIFCSFVKTLDLIDGFLHDIDCNFLRLDGSTSQATRKERIATFKEDVNILVLLMSTQVGGLGLNLGCANKVILFNPNWNPTIDSQARDRAWRLGQEREVSVFRLISRGTIEHKMYERQVFKEDLIARILQDPRQRRYFEKHSLRDLFSYKEGKDTSLIKKIGMEGPKSQEDPGTAILFKALSRAPSEMKKLSQAARDARQAIEALKLSRNSSSTRLVSKERTLQRELRKELANLQKGVTEAVSEIHSSQILQRLRTGDSTIHETFLGGMSERLLNILQEGGTMGVPTQTIVELFQNIRGVHAVQLKEVLSELAFRKDHRWYLKPGFS